MMDRFCTAILEKTGEYSAGRYVIFSDDELFGQIPKEERSAEGLRKALAKLVNDGYIDVKYSSGNLFCIAPIKKYVPEIISEPSVSEAPKPVKMRISAFWTAFCGGALGSFLATAIAMVLNYAF